MYSNQKYHVETTELMICIIFLPVMLVLYGAFAIATKRL